MGSLARRRNDQLRMLRNSYRAVREGNRRAKGDQMTRPAKEKYPNYDAERLRELIRETFKFAYEQGRDAALREKP
jgi:ribosomal 50S subunit-associated protein YjgA (DUF615 family)